MQAAPLRTAWHGAWQPERVIDRIQRLNQRGPQQQK